MRPRRNSLFYILGPTASGKTALAAELARRCGAEIVGADAFQVYQGLDLLTAKPSREFLASVPHHLVGEIPLQNSFDVAQYANLAQERIERIQAQNKPVLIVGGTGLYVRALTHGLAELPPADPRLRQELEKLSLEELADRLRILDPNSAAHLDFKNPRRLIRALEVCLLTDRPFSSFRQQWESPTTARGIILDLERPELYSRINRRTELMFEQGVVEEVRNTPEVGPTAAQAIGLRDIRSMLANQISLQECVANIQHATRRYAKRQLTWFRREISFEIIQPGPKPDFDRLLEILLNRAFSKQRQNFS